MSTDGFTGLRRLFAVRSTTPIIVLIFIIALVYSRLIPSNQDYEKYWYLSSLKMGILDLQGNIFFMGKRDRKIDNEIILKAEHHPIPLDRNHYIESAKIQGGYSYWVNDITVINSLREELLNFGNFMSE